MNSGSSTAGIRRLGWQHRRFLTAVYLCVAVGMLVLFGVDRLRTAFLYRIERGVAYWDDRWARRVAYGEQLIKSQRYATAAAYLERLDREFPAQSVKHKRDVERERILRGLGRSYAQMSQKRSALDAYRRLVAFEPRNFANHSELAIVCAKFGETDEAITHVKSVLAIHPTHLPSLRHLLTYHFDSADYEAVVASYERYLDAFLLQQLAVSLGESTVHVEVPIDGRLHDIQVRISQEREWSGQLCIGTGGVSIEVKEVTFEAPVFVGDDGTPAGRAWSAKDGWQVEQMKEVRAAVYRPLGAESAIRLEVPNQPRGVALVLLRLRLLKPVDVDSWAMVEASHRNLLMNETMHAARDRSAIGAYVPNGL